MAAAAAEVKFCPFEQLFDQGLESVLLNIFKRLEPPDYDSCIVVCRDWRAFIGRNLICGEDKKTRDMVYAKKMTYEWLHGKPKVSKMKIANNLAPPLKMYADRSDIILTTIDSILVWNRRTGCYRGEFGPEIGGSNHVMIRAMAFNEHIAVSAHKHTNILVVWSKRNFKILQEVNLTGVEGTESGAAAIRVLDSAVIVWLEDGSIIVYDIVKDTQLRQRTVLNGHIQGTRDGLDVLGDALVTASGDSKVNMWSIGKGKLVWSNHRSDARYKVARMSEERVVVGGSYDQDGYLQIYERGSSGGCEVVHEMLTLEGSAITDLQIAGRHRIVALLAIRHKLLTCKLMVLNSANGDLVTERTFVDVLNMNVALGRALVLLNNQTGDFRTRISVYDLNENERMFESERVAFQYEHNYWKLPVAMDNTSVIHTSEEKSDLLVRDFDSFFAQFDNLEGLEAEKKNRLSNGGTSTAVIKKGSGGIMADSTLCRRLRKIFVLKICQKYCTIM